MSPFVFAQSTTNTITSTVTGTTTVDKTPPTASAPNIVLNNQDVCSYPASAAVQTQIFGFAAGTTVRDKNCERIKLARSLYFMGMKVAGVSLLCQDKRVFEAMEMAGTPCPYEGKIGEEALVLWQADTERRPDAREYKKRAGIDKKEWSRDDHGNVKFEDRDED